VCGGDTAAAEEALHRVWQGRLPIDEGAVQQYLAEQHGQAAVRTRLADVLEGVRRRAAS
jgi:hypothetical protein